jgi:type VI secretion system secreted protein VgrG
MMRTLFVALTISLLFHTSVSQAADPNTTKQIQQLQRQGSALQQELRTVQALINIAKDGNLFIRAKQHKQEVTGGNAVSTVSADQRTEVGRSQTETIGLSQSLTVGTNQSTTIGKDITLRVGRNLAENVAINRTMAAGKQIVITAGDRLTLKSGKSSIVLKNNGEIDIKGKNIFIKGSGPVNIKGSKVTTN